MKKIYYETNQFKADHSIYGGSVYLSDFNTIYGKKDRFNGSTIAHRIANDQKFDEQCRNNIKNRKNL